MLKRHEVLVRHRQATPLAEPTEDHEFVSQSNEAGAAPVAPVAQALAVDPQCYVFPSPDPAADCQIITDGGIVMHGRQGFHPSGRPCQIFTAPPGLPQANGCTYSQTSPGEVMIQQRARLVLGPLVWEGVTIVPAGEFALLTDDFHQQPSHSFPVNPPTRMEVLGVGMHFRGGLIVNSPDYDRPMPWWDACLSWCSPGTRDLAYDVKRRAGDTHAILQVPNGVPLYNEPNQFYNPQRFGPLDWTNGMTRLDGRFTDLVDEIVMAGFKVLINMDERQPYSVQIVRMVMEALKPRQVPWCITLPGYDGVFYGWPDDLNTIPGWARLARSIQPNCYLGIEFNVGHIPLGQGPGDYAPGGLMEGFDSVFGEFPTVVPFPTDPDSKSNITQILSRMLRNYVPDPQWPPDSAPYYLLDSPRGPRTFIAWETNEPYDWVRVDTTNPAAVAALQAQIAAEAQYFRDRGCQFVC